MKEIAYAIIPIAGMFALRRISPLAVRVAAIGGQKKRGIDYFKVRVAFKNTGDLPIENWSFYIYATATIEGRNYTHAIASGNLSLEVGETKTFPTETTYFERLVEPTTPLGTWDCTVTVADVPVGESGRIVATKTIPNAWEIIEPVKAVEIVKVEVA